MRVIESVCRENDERDLGELRELGELRDLRGGEDKDG